jgi:predicted nucleic acid-binding Zn ribbon protein
LADRGWQGDAAVAAVTADWESAVGEDLAAHCRPESLRAGVLTITAESTAWATQIRLLTAPLIARITESFGAGLVRSVVVHGPTGPSWTHGPRRVPGRGPRDTYG